MTDDLIVNYISGGAYEGNPDKIASIFEGEGNLKHRIDEPLVFTYLSGRREEWSKALDYINFTLDMFRQWAYRRTDGNIQLQQEVDGYINSLYKWLDDGIKTNTFSSIEFARLKAEKTSLTDKFYNYVPERLILDSLKNIEQMFNDIQNYEYATRYPSKPSDKWYNSEIERLALISERIELLIRLVERTYSETADKYNYMHYLQEVVFDISSYIGVLERSKYELCATVGKVNLEEHLSKIDNDIADTNEKINRHFSELKDRLNSKRPLAINQAIQLNQFGTGQNNGKAKDDLTDTERNIIQSLGESILKGQELLKKAGYDYSSHYKTILSNLCKREILENIHKKGYKLKHSKSFQ